MVVALIEFPMSFSDPERADELWKKSIDRYTGVPGLIRKYYLHSEDGAIGAGVYLFESKEAAERFYNAEWQQFFRERYGRDAEIRYFRCPIVVDNEFRQVVTAEGTRSI